jgi:hypothetical protein
VAYRSSLVVPAKLIAGALGLKYEQGLGLLVVSFIVAVSPWFGLFYLLHVARMHLAD